VTAEYFIGLMSGTSRDGLDAVLVELDDETFRLVGARMTPYPDSISEPLWRLVETAHCGIDELGRLHTRFGEFAAACCDELLREAQSPASSVTAIGFSGHTVFHQPDPPDAFTLQLGNANVLAARTGITTIADFRGMDIAVGGQGAPLLPAFHASRFSDPTESRVVVNIGGISNLTRLTPGQPVTGFDSGSGNTLMDTWSRMHAIGEFDNNGNWAASGAVLDPMLRAMQSDSYFDREPPKSTGLERFNGE
jgi:anhydro-N-acetylmuramic acid kinase